jgi:TRAP-type mannitol/chloroaromatic compound transport system substrate-binding protein
VSVHAAGELMPAFGVVDALQNGTIEMAQTAPYYFTGKDPIFAFGCAVPFGLTARQMDSWMEHGNGRKLMDAFYAKYNMRSFSAGNTGTQMGGWYRKEIKSVADLKGLKMRMGGGLFGEAMAKLGVVAQNMPAGEVYQALEKGTLDATEFVGPYDDEKLGFNKVAPSTTTPAGGKAAPSWSSSSTPRPTTRCRPRTRRSSMPPPGRRARHDRQVRRREPDGAEAPGGREDAAQALHQGRDGRGLQGLDGSVRRARSQVAEFKKIHQDMRAFQRDQLLWTRFSEWPPAPAAAPR